MKRGPETFLLCLALTGCARSAVVPTATPISEASTPVTSSVQNQATADEVAELERVCGGKSEMMTLDETYAGPMRLEANSSAERVMYGNEYADTASIAAKNIPAVDKGEWNCVIGGTTYIAGHEVNLSGALGTKVTKETPIYIHDKSFVQKSSSYNQRSLRELGRAHRTTSDRREA